MLNKKRKALFFLFMLVLTWHKLYALEIYRPENFGSLNDIPCLLSVQDLDGHDASESIIHLSYSWYYELRDLDWRGEPKVLHTYFDGCFTGGAVLHLLLKPGTYRISVYTPRDYQVNWPEGSAAPKTQWQSNTFIYKTGTQLKVIFVSPVANQNGFFNGNWHISHRAPKFYKYTKPRQ